MTIYIDTDEGLTMDNWWAQDEHSEVLFGNLSESEQIRLADAVEQVAQQMRNIIKKKRNETEREQEGQILLLYALLRP